MDLFAVDFVDSEFDGAFVNEDAGSGSDVVVQAGGPHGAALGCGVNAFRGEDEFVTSIDGYAFASALFDGLFGVHGSDAIFGSWEVGEDADVDTDLLRCFAHCGDIFGVIFGAAV